MKKARKMYQLTILKSTNAGPYVLGTHYDDLVRVVNDMTDLLDRAKKELQWKGLNQSLQAEIDRSIEDAQWE